MLNGIDRDREPRDDWFTVVSKITNESGIAKELAYGDGIEVTMEDGVEIFYESLRELGIDFTWEEVDR